jgi:nucleoid-associated protein YgaU
MASSPDTVSRQGQAAGVSDGARDSSSMRPDMPASAEIRRDPPKHEADPAVVFVPEVRTARIERGDSLWAISRRTYGEGDRYTAIYDANQDQIRDPDLIYPGQVFVLPIEDTIETPRDEKRG